MGTTANESTAVTTTDTTRLPDLAKPANLLKFASFWEGKKLERLTGEQQTYFLATLGQHIGVRAELGEILLYQGKPYITIDGRLRIAHETGLLDGIQVRPATAMEFQNYGAETGDVLWVCYVFKKGARRAFTGWGHVRQNDRNPVAKTHPRELAKKRAKYDALRAAFPPKESIGALQLHTDLAEDAEAHAETVRSAIPAISSAEYDEMPDDISVLGEEIAALASSGINPYGEEDGTPAKPPADELTDEEIAKMDAARDGQLAIPDARKTTRKSAVRDGGL